jgi:E3 ubiquitin-protein ligase TRIP12
MYAFGGGGSTPSSSATATPAPASETATPTPADSPHEDEPSPTSKESPPDRTDMLRGKPEVVGRFMQLTVPILVDVYAASVITTVRIKTLTGLLKAISYLEADEIKRVLIVSIQTPTSLSVHGINSNFSPLVCTYCKFLIVYPII